MNTIFNTILTMAMAVAMTVTNITAGAAAFKDTSGHWGDSYIAEMADMGILNGYEDGTFRPDNNMTRAEFATMLFPVAYVSVYHAYNAFGFRDINTYYSKFTDCDENAWYADGVYGISQIFDWEFVSANEGIHFNPNRNITRGEVAEVIGKYMDCALMNNYGKRYNLNTYTTNLTDISSGTYAAMLDSYGIMSGAGNNQFKPNDYLTRAECAAIMSRTFVVIQEVNALYE